MTLPVCALAASLCMPVVAQSAWADEVSDAQKTLSQAEERLSQITEEHAALQQEADELQTQIDGAVEGVMTAQTEMQEGRARLGEMVAREYKTGGISLLHVVLDSGDLNELVNNLHYMDAVQKAQAEEIEDQRQREETFNAALSDMDRKKDEQMSKIADAEKKSEEAAKVVSDAESKLTKAKDDAAAAAEAQRLAAMKAQADALAAAEESKKASQPPATAVEQPKEEKRAESSKEEAKESASESEKADSSSSESASKSEADDSASTGGSSSNGSSSSSQTETEKPSASTGWSTGVASAYGAVSDGTLGGMTATGDIVTESSMGVAIPLAWNDRSYLGRQVEINYGGKTVIATVNDLGGMGNGSRHLDLQPGVWRALGASSCEDWGLRTVSYRFL